MKRRQPAPGGAANLERARAALARAAWSEACQAFAAAEAAAEGLTPDDLAGYAVAAGLAGPVEGQLRLLERAYEAHLAHGDEPAAARSAFWLGMRLFSIAEPARASAWLARAQRLVEGKDCVERGYVLLPSVRRLETAGDHAGAEAAAAEAASIGDRFRDTDLSAFARCFHGRLLVRLGRVDAGLALLDEALGARQPGARARRLGDRE
ncbi:MAG TPA: hypothetical protein VIU64_02585 [Polyangia bacterium]